MFLVFGALISLSVNRKSHGCLRGLLDNKQVSVCVGICMGLCKHTVRAQPMTDVSSPVEAQQQKGHLTMGTAGRSPLRLRPKESLAGKELRAFLFPLFYTIVCSTPSSLCQAFLGKGTILKSQNWGNGGMGKSGRSGPEESQSFLCFTLPVR